MKCPNCKKELVIPDVVYRNLENYSPGGTKLIASNCCSTGFLVRMNISYTTTLYTGNQTEDEWGTKLNKNKI